MKRRTVSERALILAPRGRDGSIAASLLAQAGFVAEACPALSEVICQLNQGAAFVVATEEALTGSNLSPLAEWLSDQEEWSDLPFVLLTNRGGGLERNPAARRFLDILGNVTFLERPFHPTTLVSLARSALRARRRQYEARARLADLRGNEAHLRELNSDLERRVIERALERGRNWQLSPEIMCVLSAEGYFIASNPSCRTVLGWTEQEISNSVYFDLIHPDDKARTRETWASTIHLGRPFHCENRCRTKNAEFRWLSWIAMPDDGKIYCTARDITAEKKQAEALAQAEEALRQAQKMEAVGQLTGGVAHDFNNLLTIIKSSTELLRRPDLAEERRRRYVDAISDTVDRAARLTGQLLAFARRQALKPEIFNVAERIGAVTEMLRTIMGSRVKITADLPAATCLVRADLVQFETALVNMAVNARDAMNGEGALDIRVQPVSAKPAIRGHQSSEGRFVAVSLADTGSGIAADRLNEIFEPFYTTKEVGKGTGLGLSQVYGFVKQSGGDIEVASELGRGTVFTLYLPAFTGSAVAVEEAVGRRQSPGDMGGGRRVLVVEDNVDVGRFSTQLLEDLGYQTSWAANATEALRLLDHPDGFDAVFSDVVMPGMSGVELGKEIKRRFPGLPVILTSGYSHVLAEEGPHGFELLHKPYNVEDLSAVLRKVMKRAA